MDQLQSKFRIAELPSDPDDRHFVTALARGLDLLACFRRGEGSFGVDLQHLELLAHRRLERGPGR